MTHNDRGFWIRPTWVRPRAPIADDRTISWTDTWRLSEAPGLPEALVDELLDSYVALAVGDPEEMAQFVSKYGAPEIGDGSSVSVRDLRRHARGVAAARRLGAALVTRHPGSRDDWKDAINWLTPESSFMNVDPEDLDDWKLGRERLGDLISQLMRLAGVRVVADWKGKHQAISLEPETESLIGAVAILLAREVGPTGRYECDVCGASVYRARAPMPGHLVYCERAECKREQRRRHTAAHRAKTRGN